MYFLRVIIVIILAGTAFSASAYEYKLTSGDKNTFKSASARVKRGQYDAAIAEASRASDKTILKLIKWMSYREGYAQGGSLEIASFIEKNSYWPGMKTLKNKLEFSLTGKEPANDLIEYFNTYPPATGHGMRILADAKIATGAGVKETAQLIKQAWEQGDFSREEEEIFLSEHGRVLTEEDHYKRADRMLWEGDTTGAKRMYRLLSGKHKNFVQARLDIDKNPSAITKLPSSMREDPAILYELVKTYNERENFDQVYQSLYTVVGTMPFQPKWWKIKNRLVRELMDRNELKKAYYIAKNHGNEEGSAEYPESEWLAGWIALRFLGNSQDAYKHFYNMFNNVKFPVSISRAAYWAGRAAEANKNQEIADNWYEVAAKHATTFYGQLAFIKRYGEDTKLVLPKDPTMGMLQENTLKLRELLSAAYILESSGQSMMAEKFIKAAINSVETPAEMAYIGEFGLRIGRTNFSVVAGKEALAKGVALVTHGWPSTKYMPRDVSVEKPFVLSIIRQESVFNPNALSSANAMGLMQLIPATAKRMAKSLKMPYAPARLLSQPEYNIKLGSYYLGSLVEQWNGSYILAIASYNAGPGNAKKWTKKYRDPRELRDTDEVIDWIESIPFNETRNYVQRVLENIQVYRSKEPGNKLTLEGDLMRGAHLNTVSN